MLLSVRELLSRQRTQLVNALRGHAAEFGLVVASARKMARIAWAMMTSGKRYRQPGAA